jgi:RimJ/RimL family protein N-acetyltransferase
MIEKISAKEYRRNVKDKIKRDLGAGYDELIPNGQDIIICEKSEKGEIIGCAYGVNSGQVAKNYIKEIDHNKLSSVFHTIWIDENHRGKGLGTKLGSKLTDNLKSYTLTEV